MLLPMFASEVGPGVSPDPCVSKHGMMTSLFHHTASRQRCQLEGSCKPDPPPHPSLHCKLPCASQRKWMLKNKENGC